MEPASMSSLLLSEEEKIRNELRADAVIDRDRKQSLERLNAVFDRVLLRYNAANSNDGERQALADCEAAAVRDMLGLLLAGTAQKEISRRRLRAGAVIGFLLSVIGVLAAILLSSRYAIAAGVSMLAACCFAFLAGRLWSGEREVRVHAGLDSELVWRTLKKATETMDRKLEEYLSQHPAQNAFSGTGVSSRADALSEEELKLFGDLLEALYSENGDFALRQLKKIQPCLRHLGIETADCTPETRELFELLPSKRASATLRPALFSDGRLLLAGRATERIDEP